MSIRFVGRRISNFLTYTSVLHHIRDLISQNHCLGIRYMHLNSNLINRTLSFTRLLSPNKISQNPVFLLHSIRSLRSHARLEPNSAVEMMMDEAGVRFCIGEQHNQLTESEKKRKRIRDIRYELRLYRSKARAKMRSPNPEVRILYRLGKAKRKEEWLIEKLRKFNVRKAPAEVYDPESLTEEEKFYLKRTGEKKKHYVPVGRRGLIGGVVLNMHQHWKNHETVKVVCKPCKPGQIQEYADELTRLSKGIVIDIKPNNVIIFYRGKNYVQPKIMSPPDTLPKAMALVKYKYEQSLEHTGQFIEKLEKELEEYYMHKARFDKEKEKATRGLSG